MTGSWFVMIFWDDLTPFYNFILFIWRFLGFLFQKQVGWFFLRQHGIDPKIFFSAPRVYCIFFDFENLKLTVLIFFEWQILVIFKSQKMTIGSFWKTKWKKRWSEMFCIDFLRVLFLWKSEEFYKNWILGGDFEMLFLHKKRSKSFILSIYTLIEFTIFEKRLFFLF